MAKQIDKDFFRCLIFRCLGYAPELPEAAHLPEMKFLNTIRSIINFIRSDYYCWFFVLISCIPPKDWKKETLKAQVKCINLKDKKEEFLLSCSFLIQIAQFVVLKYRCFRHVSIAANCMSEIFDYKYREGFSDTDELESYCETLLQRKRKIFRDGEKRTPEMSKLDDKPRGSGGRNIHLFWSTDEHARLLNEYSKLDNSEDEDVYFNYLTVKVEMINKSPKVCEAHIMDSIREVLEEAVRRMPNRTYCLKAMNGSCFGCVLAECYPKMEEESYCRLGEGMDSKFNNPEIDDSSSNTDPPIQLDSEGISFKSDQWLDTDDKKEDYLRMIKVMLDETSQFKKRLSNMVNGDASIKLDDNEASLELDSKKEMEVAKSCTEMKEDFKTKHFELNERLDTKDNSLDNSTSKTDNDDNLLKLDKDTTKVEICFSEVNDDDDQQVTDGLFTFTPEDMPISRIKIIKHVLVWGVIAMNRMLLTSLLIISKQLKSTIYSLLKLFFYTWRLFGRMIFGKNEIGENKCALTLDQDSRENPPTLHPVLEEPPLTPENYSDESKENLPFDLASLEWALPLEDNSIEKGNPQVLDPVLEECALTLEDDSTEKRSLQILDPVLEEFALTLEDNSTEQSLQILDPVLEECALNLEDNSTEQRSLQILDPVLGKYDLTLEGNSTEQRGPQILYFGDDLILDDTPVEKENLKILIPGLVKSDLILENSTEKNENSPASLDPVIRERALTLEDCSIENEVNSQIFDPISGNNIFLKTMSTSKEEGLETKLLFKESTEEGLQLVNSMNSLFRSGVEAESHGLLEPQSIETVLVSVEATLNSISGITILRQELYDKIHKNTVCLTCPYCNTKCFEIFFDYMDVYKKYLKNLV